MLRRHLLPNLVGPIVVYATLSVPAAILQESFLSFLTIGVRGNIPSWGKLASVAPGVVMAALLRPLPRPLVALALPLPAAGGDADVAELYGRRAAGRRSIPERAG